MAPDAARPLPSTRGRREEAARQADALAVGLKGALDSISVPLARSAAAFVETRGWWEFGFARLEDHARERFGRSGRWVRDLAALGRTFSTLPALEAAVSGADGGPPLGRVAAVLVASVVSGGTLARWTALARSVSVRELKDAVARARKAGSAEPVSTETAGVSADPAPEGPAGAADGPAPRETVGGSPAGAPGEASDGTPGDPPDDLDERVLVRLEAPLPVAAAFDEALDLYRAVEGRDASVTSFVEALVAEAASSGIDLPDPLDGACREPLRRAEGEAAAERALARSTNGWEHLPREGRPDWALRLAGSSLEALAWLTREVGHGDAAALDAQIRALVALEDEVESRLGSLLAQMADDGAWSRLRFASSVHYAEQRLGMRRTAARMRVRVARALRLHPVLKQAYERGEIGAEAAWLAVRSMEDSPGAPDAAAEKLWSARAAEATVKRLRDEARLIRRRRAGIEEAVEGDAGRARDAEENDAGAGAAGSRPPSDADWQASLRREPGTARRRVEALGRIAGQQRGSDVFLTLRLPSELASDFLGVIESARRRLERRAAEVPWDAPWPEPDPPGSIGAAREFFIRCRRTPAWVGLLAPLEEFVATWDADGGRRSRSARDRIFIRDGWRCAAPGCTSRRNLEEHHLTYRSRGGGDEDSNRRPLCKFHHLRGEHGGLARCRGRAPLDVVWSLGRGGIGGRFRNEVRYP